ncbi:MAG: alpha/beta hydrolase fold domain-containing protein [Dehalococcoidales bacterium]|nr:alpha/beta hydrolase fold domain-containing protein [Dehalococcoidales bacterium]
MLNEESILQLKEAESLNKKPIYEISIEEARNQFTKDKELNPLPEVEIKYVEEKKIFVNNTEINIRIFSNSDDSIQPLLVNFHGGGWVLGDLDADDQMCRELSKLSGRKVISIDYRLSPENKFPIPLQDCYKSLIYLYENHKEFGIDKNNISICGTSAGGNLAAAVSMLVSETKKNIIKSQILFCPVTNNNFETDSYKEFNEGFGLTKKVMEWFWDQYIDNEVNKYSALNKDKDITDLPKTFIAVAECDILKSEAIEYYGLIKEKNNVTLKIYDGALHGFNVNIGKITNANKCMMDVKRFLN